MSVEKLDTVKLIKEKIPFTIHSNYVLQNVHEYLPLAIWCYLTSLPDDWEVHRNQLMNHFNIGRDKLATALKFLNENKLIEYLQAKYETGKFAISHIVVKNGVEFEVIHRNATALLKNRATVLPVSGESAPTNTISSTKKIKEKNKSFYSYKHENQKQIVDKSPIGENQPRVSKEEWKQANQKKHSWAEKAKESPRADVSSQSTSFKREEHQSIQHSPEAVQKAMMSLPRHMRPKRYRDANPDDDKTKATELPTGTPVQPEVSTRSEPDEQGASVDVDGKQIDSPPVRGSNRLMETRRVHTFLEKAGMACAN